MVKKGAISKKPMMGGNTDAYSSNINTNTTE
jgi:hypothetical protein